MARINRARAPMAVDQVRGDEKLQSFLEGLVGSSATPSEIELDNVFESIQSEFPGAQYLAANLITSGSREALLSELVGWKASVNPEFDVVNSAVFREGRRIGVLSVMSRRIPRFTLSAVNETGGRFFNECPHCGEVHALEIARESRTLILSCPYCELPFDVLASDTDGMIRRANDFFDGFTLVEPPSMRARLSDRERVVALWQRIADRCEYELDNSRSDHREVWKSSRETWEERAGDCEDTSILLADVLIEAGFQARVAIGWNGNIGQHAWVVVEIDGEQYVLESTLQTEIDQASLNPVVEAAAFYQPEQLFDRENVYYSDQEPELFATDYFSPGLWKAIPQAPLQRSKSLSLR
ncbi:MAG: transglutaminase-like domain-containing protein [Verrucomicrobiota bacterium]